MRILFEGDSITDCGKNATCGSRLSIGQGYAMLVTAKLSAENPGKYDFVNDGISGSRVVDIYSRIKKGCWNYEPDVISILVGINDVWHEINESNGVELDRYKNVYSMYVEDTLKRLPDVKMMLMTPFVLKGSATEENWDIFYNGAAERAAVVEEIAKKYNQIFIPLQDKFEEAEKLYPQPYWIADGVHPTPAGHQIIANAWLEAFDKHIK